MVPATRRAGKSPMTSKQEQLEQSLQNVEELIARMNGMMETLVQNQGHLMCRTDGEQADVLRVRLQAERKKVAAEVAARGATITDLEEESANGSNAETQNLRS